MERIIHGQLTNYLICNNLLSASQHGFQAGKSAVSNVLESVTDWILADDSGNNVDVLYLDLSKAFESLVFSKLF